MNESKPISVVSRAASIGSTIFGAAGLVLISQAVYVVAMTPRLPPPDHSGHDFKKEGLLVSYDYDGDLSSLEFRLVLLGDSPVEGIGNDHHAETLAGQTALQFSKRLRRPVRYWAFGKSGLTAKGIQQQMLPHLSQIQTNTNDNNIADAIVVSCGVNNTLQGHSPQTFGQEVIDLLSSVRRYCPATTTPILVMELLDFDCLPFIPYPLRSFASWRSRALRDQMERVIDEAFLPKNNIVLTIMPKVEELLGQRHECWLLRDLSYQQRQSLTLEDFFADDNFHPANIGNTIVGILLAQTYHNIMTPKKTM